MYIWYIWWERSWSCIIIFECTGQDWDADLEEYVNYNLTNDAARTLSLTDEEFLVALKDKGSLAGILKDAGMICTFIYIHMFMYIYCFWRTKNSWCRQALKDKGSLAGAGLICISICIYTCGLF